MGRDVVLGEEMMETAAIRTVVLASADAGLRQRLRVSLTGLRWQVREAGGGAEAMAFLEESRPEAMLVDSWLPDLEVGEFAGQIRQMYPGMDLLRVDGATEGSGTKSPLRNELLHALREAQEAPMNDTVAWAGAPVAVPSNGSNGAVTPGRVVQPFALLPRRAEAGARTEEIKSMESGGVETGRINAGRVDSGRMDSGRMDSTAGRVEVAASGVVAAVLAAIPVSAVPSVAASIIAT